MSMPKVIFDDWKHPSVDGWPPEWEWCMVIWGVDADATPDIFVGGYSEETKAFYANFGMGGAVLDRERVIAWTLLSEHRWEEGMTMTRKENPAIGRNALEFIDSFLTPEEIAESDARVALVGELIKDRLAAERGLRPSSGGKDCPANGEHEGIECQCDECDFAMICFPPDEPMDERLRRVVYG